MWHFTRLGFNTYRIEHFFGCIIYFRFRTTHYTCEGQRSFFVTDQHICGSELAFNSIKSGELFAIFRGAGDAVIAMRTLWLANALNIVLGPCFIFGWWIFPEMGVTGAAVATNIGRGVGVLYQLWHLAGHHSRVKVRWCHFTPEREIIGTVLSKSGSGIAQLLISTTSWVGLFKILAMFGSTALAGYTIAVRLVMFALMPAWGLANAGATLVGQNLGAGKPERAEAAVRIATKFNILVLSVVGIGFVLFAGPLIRRPSTPTSATSTIPNNVVVSR